MRNKIRKGNDAILRSMMGVVERHVKQYHVDFYVHMCPCTGMQKT
ncbi:hypothetical protein [Neobacillus sp. 19]